MTLSDYSGSPVAISLPVVAPLLAVTPPPDIPPPAWVMSSVTSRPVVAPLLVVTPPPVVAPMLVVTPPPLVAPLLVVMPLPVVTSIPLPRVPSQNLTIKPPKRQG